LGNNVGVGVGVGVGDGMAVAGGVAVTMPGGAVASVVPSTVG